MNIFLVDSGEADTRAEARAKQPKIVEPNILEVLLSWAIVLLGRENSSGSQKIEKSHKKLDFFDK